MDELIDMLTDMRARLLVGLAAGSATLGAIGATAAAVLGA